jgi:putative transposase
MNSLIIDQHGLDDKQILKLEDKMKYVEPLAADYISPEEKKDLRNEAYRLLNISERTLRKWVADYKSGGEAALIRKEREDTGQLRAIKSDIVIKAIELLTENPHRSIRHVLKLLTEEPGEIGTISQSVHPGTLYHHIKKSGFSFKRARNSRSQRVYRRFEVEYANKLWQGDARHGIPLPHPEQSEKIKMTYLYAWIDDYSRKILFAKYFWDEKLPRLEESLRQAILRWGIPEKLYCDNGATYASKQFTLITSNIGTRKIHHPPYQAWCKGKVEIVMKVLKRFQEEVRLTNIQTIDELNNTLWAWIDVEYNRKYHSSIGQTPDERFHLSIDKHPARRVTNIEMFDSYFLWQEERIVNKYGFISLNRNQYRIRDVGIGEKVLVRYDPFNLQDVHVYHKQKYIGAVKAYKFQSAEYQNMPEESKTPTIKVSQAANRYFENIREEYRQKTQDKHIPFSNIIDKDCE